ncbi:hypothetical protein LTR37_013233 [Vermiconidia calcicola]|uniref:Uncharacterized protein n=1 Tax=Vermiconidia calcicola TaxID=1690605 RepID=A0ACC3MX26_9PEZI|nr:hypothetical protein LTR37_013233 [Vermiconidia calcicola]
MKLSQEDGRHREDAGRIADLEKARAAREAENANSVLLRLPAELKNNIYELVLPRNRAITLDTRRDPPLTRVCRTVRNESLPIYLGHSYVAMVFLGPSYCWQKKVNIRGLPEAAAAAIRQVELQYKACRFSCHGSAYMLLEFTPLHARRRTAIGLCRSCYEGIDRHAEQPRCAIQQERQRKVALGEVASRKEELLYVCDWVGGVIADADRE